MPWTVNPDHGYLEAYSTVSGPVVPTSFDTDDGTAVPAGNILIISGTDSSENNDNGIIVKGGTPQTAAVNEVDVVLTNRATGTVSTANATPTVVLTFALGATPGVYFFEGYVTAFDVTDTAGGAYSFVSGARTTGVVGTEIGTEMKDVLEEAAMASADFAITVSANNLVVTVTGIAAKSINWNCYLTYRFVSQNGRFFLNYRR